MKDTEVLSLLIYANELDGRHAPNEAKVFAWSEVLNESAPGMPLDFATGVIKKHYSKLEVMISPAVIVKAWHDYRRVRADAALSMDAANADRHCKRSGCMCSHTEPCYKGWVDPPSNDRTVPCPVCRRDLLDVLDRIPPLGLRGEHDYALLRTRHSVVSE